MITTLFVVLLTIASVTPIEAAVSVVQDDEYLEALSKITMTYSKNCATAKETVLEAFDRTIKRQERAAKKDIAERLTSEQLAKARSRFNDSDILPQRSILTAEIIEFEARITTSMKT